MSVTIFAGLFAPALLVGPADPTPCGCQPPPGVTGPAEPSPDPRFGPVSPVAPPTTPVSPVAPPTTPVSPVAPPTTPVSPVAPPTTPVSPVAPPTTPVSPVAPPTTPVSPVAPPTTPPGANGPSATLSITPGGAGNFVLGDFVFGQVTVVNCEKYKLPDGGTRVPDIDFFDECGKPCPGPSPDSRIIEPRPDNPYLCGVRCLAAGTLDFFVQVECLNGIAFGETSIEVLPPDKIEIEGFGGSGPGPLMQTELKFRYTAAGRDLGRMFKTPCYEKIKFSRGSIDPPDYIEFFGGNWMPRDGGPPCSDDDAIASLCWQSPFIHDTKTVGTSADYFQQARPGVDGRDVMATWQQKVKIPPAHCCYGHPNVTVPGKWESEWFTFQYIRTSDDTFKIVPVE